MNLIKVGKFIAEKRKQFGLTQFDLAEKLDITDRAVSKWETGLCLPDSSIMPKLCEILGITINDLFSGETVDMKENEKKLEENLLEMAKMREERDRRLLHLEVVMGIVCLIPFFISIIVASTASMDDWARIVIVLACTLPLLIVTPFAIRIEQKAGYYQCGKCHHKYIPKYGQVFLAPHINRTRYMKCPKCHKRSWNKKVLSN